MILSRRGFLGGLLAAPFVVRSGVLMPLRGVVLPAGRDFIPIMPEFYSLYPMLGLDAYSAQVLTPMMDRLAARVAEDIMYAAPAGGLGELFS